MYPMYHDIWLQYTQLKFRGVYENRDNVPYFKLSPAEEEIVVENIE